MNINHTLVITASVLSLLLLQRCQVAKDNVSVSQGNYDSMRLILEDLYNKDQGIREIYMSENHLNDSSFVSEMQAIDRNNQTALIAILEKYGWISSRRIGEKASDAIFMIIQHADSATTEKYFPQLKAQAQAGNANKVDAAMMEDRILLRRGQKQIYGTQARKGRADNIMRIWPVANPRTVDSVRKSVGFELTVRENAQRLGAVYDPQLELSDVQ